MISIQADEAQLVAAPRFLIISDESKPQATASVRAFVQRIKASVEATHRPEVIGGLGGFGGLMRLPAGMRKPLLVSGTDGVGTKLELAQEHGSHHGVGIDLVAMCVNDVITSGAAPLFFLDYMATGALAPSAMAEVCLLYTSPSPRDGLLSRMPSSA